MRGEQIGIEFGKGASLAGEAASPPGGAARAFAGLFAATASLTGAAMTARTVCRAGAGPERQKANRRRTGIPVCGLPIRLHRSTQSQPEALTGEIGGAVAAVLPQPVGDQAMAAE